MTQGGHFDERLHCPRLEVRVLLIDMFRKMNWLSERQIAGGKSMPYYVRITTDTDGLLSDTKPYLTLADAMQVAGLSLKTGRATTAWIEDDDGKVCANTDDVKKHCGLN